MNPPPEWDYEGRPHERRRWRAALFLTGWLVLVLVCLVVWTLAVIGAASVFHW